MGYIPPIDLYLDGEVVKAWHRIKSVRAEIWDGVGKAQMRGHRRSLSQLAASFGEKGYIWDEIPEFKKSDRLYKVNTDSFKHGVTSYGTVKCFTDGSRINGRVGAGYCIMVDDTVVAEKAIPLGTYPTVFQAEVTAIHEAAEELLKFASLGKIVIHSDSQAALMALNSASVTAATVLSTMQNLDVLAMEQEVKLTWVRAHVGLVGNERADTLAKKGAALIPTDPEPIVPVPLCQLKRDIRAEVEKRWKARWLARTDCRQSKMFWPAPNKSRSEALAKFDRREFSDMIQLLTGHNHYGRHKNLLKEWESAECRLCLEEEESSEHLLLNCPALNGARLRCMGLRQADTHEVNLTPLPVIGRFLSEVRCRLEGMGDQR
jgi:ribonuclease HI